MKFSKEDNEFIRDTYIENASRETVDQLANKYQVSSRSIIGKLSRMGVYQKEIYTPKYSDKPVSKEEIIFHIAEELGLDEQKLSGLSKSQKPALMYLEESLVEKGLISKR